MTAHAPPETRERPGPPQAQPLRRECDTDADTAQEGTPTRPRPTVKPRVDAARFRRHVVRVAACRTWEPWAEFVDTARAYLAPGRAVADTLNAWTVVRERVLDELTELGLVGIVFRSDGERPELEQHEADLAGLVRLYPDAGDLAPEQVPVPASVVRSRAARDQHARRMLGEHGLVAADQRIPERPRAFCGQAALADHGAGPAGEQGVPEWFDHARAWTDCADSPVLTVEPYGYTDDPAALRAEVDAWLSSEQIPLTASAPLPGMWHGSTVLVVLRHNPALPPLPASHAVWVPHRWVAAHQAAQSAASGSWEAA